jgi:hypothetical protein
MLAVGRVPRPMRIDLIASSTQSDQDVASRGSNTSSAVRSCRGLSVNFQTRLDSLTRDRVHRRERASRDGGIDFMLFASAPGFRWARNHMIWKPLLRSARLIYEARYTCERSGHWKVEVGNKSESLSGSEMFRSGAIRPSLASDSDCDLTRKCCARCLLPERHVHDPRLKMKIICALLCSWRLAYKLTTRKIGSDTARRSTDWMTRTRPLSQAPKLKPETRRQTAMRRL